VPISAELSELDAALLEFLESGPPPPERANRRAEAMGVLEAPARTDAEDEVVQNFWTDLENGLSHWLPFVTDPTIELTTNRAERAVR